MDDSVILGSPIFLSMKQLVLLPVLVLMAGCAFAAPYTITFTNTPGEVIDPLSSSIDFVVSGPTLAYISKVNCEGAEGMELLPIVKEGANTSTVHKLPLTVLSGMPEGASCRVAVTVYDPTTTETATSELTLSMPEADPVVEPTADPVDEATEPTGDVIDEPSNDVTNEVIHEDINPTQPTSDGTEPLVPAEDSGGEQSEA
jgi:hypothetical protein